MSWITGCKDDDDNGPAPDKITDFDGNIYHADTIGNQVWLVENLRTTHYRNGDSISGGKDQMAFKNTTFEGACWNYNNDPAIGAVYGKLYNWYALTDPRGIAPEGFQIPSDEDWTTLVAYLGGDLVAGGKLKETGTLHWADPNGGATNESGFTALPAGAWDASSSSFTMLGQFASFWSSTESGTYFAFGRSLSYSSAQIYRGDSNRLMGWSVRCVKNI